MQRHARALSLVVFTNTFSRQTKRPTNARYHTDPEFQGRSGIRTYVLCLCFPSLLTDSPSSLREEDSLEMFRAEKNLCYLGNFSLWSLNTASFLYFQFPTIFFFFFRRKRDNLLVGRGSVLGSAGNTENRWEERGRTSDDDIESVIQ